MKEGGFVSCWGASLVPGIGVSTTPKLLTPSRSDGGVLQRSWGGAAPGSRNLSPHLCRGE